MSSPWVYNEKTISTYGSQPLIWHGVRLAPPVPCLDHYPIHDELWKIPMALKELITWNGQYTAYILSDPKATFNFTKNSTHTIQICVRIPFVFMIGPAKYDPNLGLVTCINCSFYIYINNTIPFDESWQSFYILKTRTGIWVPVDLQQPWQESPTLYVIEEILKNLKCVKHFVELLIAAILGIIAITTMPAIAGMALHTVQTVLYKMNCTNSSFYTRMTYRLMPFGPLNKTLMESWPPKWPNLTICYFIRRSISQFTKTGETKI